MSENNPYSEGEDLDLQEATENEIGVINSLLQKTIVDEDSIECGMMKSQPYPDSESDEDVAKIEDIIKKASSKEVKEERKIALDESSISAGMLAECLDEAE